MCITVSSFIINICLGSNNLSVHLNKSYKTMARSCGEKPYSDSVVLLICIWIYHLELLVVRPINEFRLIGQSWTDWCQRPLGHAPLTSPTHRDLLFVEHWMLGINTSIGLPTKLMGFRNFVIIISLYIFWRGLWTWPTWVICAPAFNPKFKKFCIYRELS